jgi:hypothetical protein
MRLSLVLAILTAAPALAQTPTLSNGTLTTHANTRGLTREFAALRDSAVGPAWIGYAVKTQQRDSWNECWSTDGGRSRIPRTMVALEGPDDLFLLFRVAERRVERITFASAECPLDAGGLTLHWLTGVTAAESLEHLNALIGDDLSRRVSSSAVVAIALHGDPRAVDRLLMLAREGREARVRGDALFWVAQRAGDKAAPAIAVALENDPDTEVKKRAVFALSQLPKDEGVPKLIDVARRNRNRAVRRQAMFWLGQSGDPRALAFFEDILKP